MKKIIVKKGEKLKQAKEEKRLIAFVDGSYTKNKDYTGYAAVLLDNDKVVESISGSIYEAVELGSVAGELFAAMKAVEYALRNRYTNILLCHDFVGIKTIATGEWGAKKPFVKKYKQYINMAGKLISIEFEFIPSHSGNKYNDIADKLARYCGSFL